MNDYKDKYSVYSDNTSIITEILACFNVFTLIKGALAIVYPVKLLITA